MSSQPVVYAFSNPCISCEEDGVQISTKCDYDELFIPKGRIICISKRGDNEVVLTLTGGQIVQLYDLLCSMETYKLLRSCMINSPHNLP